mmetsp:Transcript_43357/g.69806  ORF Transcript_43357/g.69806 Transcript_43357/m.69806 type:complete len:127 (+) Transcript_43357:338-718(+)
MAVSTILDQVPSPFYSVVRILIRRSLETKVSGPRAFNIDWSYCYSNIGQTWSKRKFFGSYSLNQYFYKTKTRNNWEKATKEGKSTSFRFQKPFISLLSLYSILRTTGCDGWCAAPVACSAWNDADD